MRAACVRYLSGAAALMAALMLLIAGPAQAQQPSQTPEELIRTSIDELMGDRRAPGLLRRQSR